MDSATEELYFQKLQELVQDEDKIVTIASFASSVGISVQNSQKLIRKYVEDHRKLMFDDLAVTYVLMGLLKGTRRKGVFMIKEEDLKTKLSLFENEPCKLIYSVQKTKHVDLNIIALVDMFDSTNIREKALPGSIVSKNCTRRVLKVKKPAAPPPPPTLKGKSSFFEPKPGKSNEINKSAEKHPVSSKNEQKSKASGSIANLFKAATAKSNQQNGEKGSESNSTPSKQSGKRKSGSLAGFLTNGVTKSSKNNNSSEAKENFQVEKKSNNESRDDIKEEEIIEIIDNHMEEEKVEEKNIKKEKAVKKAGSEKKKQNKKRQRDKSEEMPSKKRKRIVERNDSDSDDMFEREDIIEQSDDEPERIPSPVREKLLPPKNKRRKAVANTYTDEEGFVVTKTEYIYETASEDENEAPAPPKQEKHQDGQEKPKPKVIDKKKPAKNQSTLMNFFKKV